MTENTQTMTPLLINVEQAAALLGVGRSLFYSMHSSGTLGPLPIRLGRRVLWRRNELEDWINAGCPARHEWIQNNNESEQY